MDPVDEERPSAMRSSFMPPLAFTPQLNTTTENDKQGDHEEARPSRMRFTWNTATNDRPSNERSSKAETGFKSMLSMARNPLHIEKKTADGTLKIGDSTTSDKIKDLLRQYDINGDDTLDIEEVTALVEHLMKEERQGKNYRMIIIGMIVFTVVLVAAMTALTYVVVVSLKDTEVNNYILLDKGSGNPIRVQSADFAITGDGTLAYRAPYDSSQKEATPEPDSGSTLRTAQYTGITQPLHSGMAINELVEMNFIHIERDTGSVSLRVNGVARVPASQSQYGTVLQIMTDAGTVTLDGELISYSTDLEPVFENAGFPVGGSGASSRRCLLVQGQGTNIAGAYNKIVEIPLTEPLPFQEYKNAWDIAAADKWEAANLTAKIQELLDSDASDREFSSMWADWKITNGKSYTSQEADRNAFERWKLNMLPISNINANTDLSYWTALNEFSDMTLEEFTSTRLLRAPVNLTLMQENAVANPNHRRLVETFQRRRLQQYPEGFILPVVNWTQQGKVTPVKNQGACGSCWAYAAVGALESSYLITTDKFVSSGQDNSVIDLSEGQVISCTNYQSNQYFQSMGCDGGDPYEGLAYATYFDVGTESILPDTAKNTGKTVVCDTVTVRNLPLTKIVKSAEEPLYAYPFNDEIAFQKAVMLQPIAIYFEVDDAFMNYKGGIYKPATCGTFTNHNMLLVGYDKRGTQPFWIIKNQWGTGWGELGYARVAMTGDTWGPCGMYGFSAIPSLNFAETLGMGPAVNPFANPLGRKLIEEEEEVSGNIDNVFHTTA